MLRSIRGRRVVSLSENFSQRHSVLQAKRLISTSLPSTSKISQTLDDVQTYFSKGTTALSTKVKSAQNALPSAFDDGISYTPSTITLGILQSNDLKQGLFLDSILTDALSNDNTYPQILQKYRKIHSGENVKVIKGESNDTLGGGVFESTHSILNCESRLIQDAKFGDGTSEYLNRETFNNLSFVEVNDPTFSHHVKVEGAESVQFNDIPKDESIKESDVQLWVKVTSGNTPVENVNDLPYFTVVNTNRENPSVGTNLTEGLRENTFPIDLNKLEIANQKIKESISNTSIYLELYEESNINELLYTLNRETSGYKPLILLLRSISQDLQLDSKSDIAITKELRAELQNWSQESHFELQSKVIPFLDQVLLKEFTRITQLVYNSGDLTLVISNLLNGTRAKVKTSFFGKEIECHGTLKESVSNAHYLEGRIDALFVGGIHQQCNNDFDSGNKKIQNVDDYVDELQAKVANEKLPELQGRINEYLIKEIFAAPFGVFAMCNIGYIYDFITMNTAVATSALVLAVAVNTSHKKVIRMIGEFRDWYVEQLRVYIDKSANLLGNRLDESIEKFETTQKKKNEIIVALKEHIEVLEKADEKMKRKI